MYMYMHMYVWYYNYYNKLLIYMYLQLHYSRGSKGGERGFPLLGFRPDLHCTSTCNNISVIYMYMYKPFSN